MRDYDNLPIMAWDNGHSAGRVRAQLLHEEPLILQMENAFEVSAEGPTGGCHPHGDGERYLGCDPQSVLGMLADNNGWPELRAVGAAAAKAGFVADLEPARGRIVLHD